LGRHALASRPGPTESGSPRRDLSPDAPSVLDGHPGAGAHTLAIEGELLAGLPLRPDESGQQCGLVLDRPHSRLVRAEGI
jgi:hypothetical protein